SIVARAAAAGDRVAELCGRIQARELRINTEPEGAAQQVSALLDQALPELEASGDHVALYVAYRALSLVAAMRAQLDDLVHACQRAVRHAQEAGCVDKLSSYLNLGLFHGTTPIEKVLAWQDARSHLERRDYFLRGYRAAALAMVGRFDQARPMVADL